MNVDFLKPVIAEQAYPFLFATVSGAHLYGFPSPDSDYDLRGVHILPRREMLGLYPPKDTLELTRMQNGYELDLVSYDVLKFFELILKRNGLVLEQIHAPLVVYTTPEHEQLKAIAKTCVTKHHAHHYLGFAKGQWGLLMKENPHRVKPLLYVYRVLLTAIHLMQTGDIEANLLTLNDQFRLSYIADLVAKKLSGEQTTLTETDMSFYEHEYLRLMNRLEDAHQQSSLAEMPSGKPALNDLLLHLRGV